MYSLRNLQKRTLTALVIYGSLAGASAASLTRSGGEYRFLSSLPGDQMLPQISFNEKGGYLVTQDNSIDGNGLGIRARRYYADLSASRWTIQVNSEGKGEQQNGRVAVFEDGGAVFAWEGSTAAGHRIFVRTIDAAGVFSGAEIQASAVAIGSQTAPAVVSLKDKTAVVTWSEWNRDGSMLGIFAQRFSPAGGRLGETFQVNQSTTYSQRTPSVIGLSNGNFVIAWVQEFSFKDSIDIYARIYNSEGQPVTVPLRLNAAEKICANPSLAASANGFRAAWSSRRLPGGARVAAGENSFEARAELIDLISWDVVTRSFDLSGLPSSEEVTINNVTKGDQFSPRLAAFGSKHLALWTSFGQDGSDEGIYGRVLAPDGFDGNEFLVNTRTISKQINPAVAAMGQTVIAVWSSFMGGLESYELFAQNFSIAADDLLQAPGAPFVSSLSANSICVSWAEVVALNVNRYLVYVDDDTVPVESTGGMQVVSRATWQASSTHSVRLAYRTADGRVSPLSAAVTVKTWGADLNGDGLPDDWQTENWGKRWPGVEEDSDGDGATNLDEFLAGTDPTDPASVLRMEISSREFGTYLEWNTQPGNYYQLQVTSNFDGWQNIGTPRFAPSTRDSLPITVPGQVNYYRVIRMR